MDVDQCILSMGYSDSLARCMIYDETTHRFTVLIQMDFHKRCILETKMLKVVDIETEKPLLFCFTAATDGFVAVWHVHPSCDPKVPATPLISFQAHQSGVNGLDLWISSSKKK
jgi:hypothetical protein